jgi:hypothetical protein
MAIVKVTTMNRHLGLVFLLLRLASVASADAIEQLERKLQQVDPVSFLWDHRFPDQEEQEDQGADSSCTPHPIDPWATGSKIECCPGLLECWDYWNNPDNLSALCKEDTCDHSQGDDTTSTSVPDPLLTAAPSSVPSQAPNARDILPPDTPPIMPSTILSRAPVTTDFQSRAPVTTDFQSRAPVTTDFQSRAPVTTDIQTNLPSAVPSNIPSSIPSSVPSIVPSAPSLDADPTPVPSAPFWGPTFNVGAVTRDVSGAISTSLTGLILMGGGLIILYLF